MPPKEQDLPHEHCVFHRVFESEIDNIKKEQTEMRIKLEEIQKDAWSPTVITALIGLFGVIVTTIGGIAGVAMSMYAKAHGWGG
jgi:hypothetical protein